ncbi:hypothetical protein RCC89_02405 [Cytophagaceae bacterium ABcell3]|nr:hypothetical protein RCC89_02405 [Cytophagaceae bacterium ABcell3]
MSNVKVFIMIILVCAGIRFANTDASGEEDKKNLKVHKENYLP